MAKLEPGPMPFQSLVHMLVEQTQEAPDHQAFTWLENGETPGPSLTLRELDQRARVVAETLQQRGERNDRVLLLYPPGLDFVEAFYGCLYAGRVPVPANLPDPARLSRSLPRLQAIAEDANASVALTTTDLAAMSDHIFEAFPKLQEVEMLATDALEGAPSPGFEPVFPESDDLAFLQFTSGSTAVPKGVMISHRNVICNLRDGCVGLGCDRGETFVTWVPHVHDLGLLFGRIWPILTMSHSYLMSPVDFLHKPFRLMKAISDLKVSVSCGPNFAYDLCVRRVSDEERDSLDLSHFRVATVGAEPIRWETLQRFADKYAPVGFSIDQLSCSLGLAETVVYVSITPLAQAPTCLRLSASALEKGRYQLAKDGETVREIVGCGFPTGDMEVIVVRPDTREPAEDGEVGELWVRGVSVAKGYWKRPEDTEEIFNATLADGEGPYLRTGDLGFLWNGEVFVAGRIKDLIIVHGANHYPQDIEATCSVSHPALRPGCAAAFSHDVEGEERLFVAQEVRESVAGGNGNTQAELAEVVRAIRHAISDEHGIQAYGVILIPPRALPKTSSGKIQRRATKQGYLDKELNAVLVDELGSANAAAAQTGDDTLRDRLLAAPEARRKGMLQGYVRRKAAVALQMNEDELASDVSLLDLGLDSVQAMEILGEVETELNVRIDPTELFDNPSVVGLSARLDAALSAAPTAGAPASGELEEGAL